MGPSAKSWDATDNLKFFEALGFNQRETVTLMGAHSIGGVVPCA